MQTRLENMRQINEKKIKRRINFVYIMNQIQTKKLSITMNNNHNLAVGYSIIHGKKQRQERYGL